MERWRVQRCPLLVPPLVPCSRLLTVHVRRRPLLLLLLLFTALLMLLLLVLLPLPAASCRVPSRQQYGVDGCDRRVLQGGGQARLQGRAAARWARLVMAGVGCVSAPPAVTPACRWGVTHGSGLWWKFIA